MTVANFKVCECHLDSWEVIVVDNDECFEGKSTIYYHCDECGEDFAVLDYHTREILYLNSKKKEKRKPGLEGGGGFPERSTSSHDF